MRFIIIGAGAVGGTIGGRLFDSGHDVVLVARGAHLEALRTSGLRLELADRTAQLAVPAVAGPGELRPGPDDVLVLATKTQDTPAALAAWEGFGDRPALVCAQNGVENERLALRRFSDVYGMCVWLPSSFLEPGVVRARNAPLTGILTVGRYPSGTDGRVRRIAGCLEASGFEAPVTDEVMAWKYAKLLTNLGNAVDAVSGPDGDPELGALAALALAEGRSVLAAAGVTYVGDEEQRRVRGTKVQPRTAPDGTSGGRSSSWQSLARATGSVEADYLNGEIVLLGRRFGVATPVNEALQRAANRLARERRPAGALTPRERADLLAAAR
ncbi:ketopantoate reductase family protein [Actinacidiphila yeochonensis]|uniref:ketopantoate reductase family protein n=1 Tax=Actinacidiphila yeochonensis TaxID=89050 RepID=UPI0005635E93|nr:2-dehydropantoate 2-reductase [Actinacidiphila yeochonensis]